MKPLFIETVSTISKPPSHITEVDLSAWRFLLVVVVRPLTFVLNLLLLLLTIDPLLVVLQSIFSECLVVTVITLEVDLVVLFLVPVK